MTGSPRLDQMARGVRSLDGPARDAHPGVRRRGAPDDRIVLVATKHAQMRRAFPDLVSAARPTPARPACRQVPPCRNRRALPPRRRRSAPCDHRAGRRQPRGPGGRRGRRGHRQLDRGDRRHGVRRARGGRRSAQQPQPVRRSRRHGGGPRRARASLRRCVRSWRIEEARAALAERQRAFLAEFVPEPDGRAAARAAAAIVDLAGGNLVPGCG